MEDNERYRLTDKGKENCLKMIDDGVAPSELGYDFSEAAVIMSAFSITIREALEEMDKAKNCNHELKSELTDLLKKANNLKKSFFEAARITKEWPE
jgi:hypothetical protein